MQRLRELLTVKVITIIILITIIFFVIVMFFWQSYLNQKESYDEVSYQELNYQLDSIVNFYESFSEYVYDSLIDAYVLETMSTAWNGDDTVKDVARNDLQVYLKDEYDLISEYNFRQLHFHFPDSTSFLRMHRVEKYGDSLVGVRYSVEYTNEFLKKSVGFEEGRIFNGYRYVYPLVYQGNHVGSVEVSVSLSTVLSLLTNMYDDADFCFILSREVVESKVFDSELDNYTTSFISDDFLYDNETESCIDDRNTLSQADFQSLLEQLTTKEKNQLLTYDNYVLIKRINNTDFSINFIPLQNIEGNNVGYFINVSPSFKYQQLSNSFHFNIIALFVLYTTLIVTVFLIENNRINLRDLSEKDRLTNIYNRRKFDERLHKEIARSKRHNTPFSLIMFDIDHFKLVNDTFGHINGDEVLKTIANVVMKDIRVEDTFARFGGEEFILILTGANIEDALRKAERIRELIEKTVFDKVGTVTVSLGVCEYQEKLLFDDLLRYVDLALYKAKESGRNKVVPYK